MANNPKILFIIVVQYLSLLAVLMFVNVPANAFARSPCPGIHVQILNIRNSAGVNYLIFIEYIYVQRKKAIPDRWPSYAS